MVCLTGQARARAHRNALRGAAALKRSAALKVDSIERCGTFTHTPCGNKMSAAMSRTGYARGCYSVGENLAWVSVGVTPAPGRQGMAGLTRAPGEPARRRASATPAWRAAWSRSPTPAASSSGSSTSGPAASRVTGSSGWCSRSRRSASGVSTDWKSSSANEDAVCANVPVDAHGANTGHGDVPLQPAPPERVTSTVSANGR